MFLHFLHNVTFDLEGEGSVGGIEGGTVVE